MNDTPEQEFERLWILALAAAIAQLHGDDATLIAVAELGLEDAALFGEIILPIDLTKNSTTH